MNRLKEIESWEVPNWHKDFGNPDMELKILKEACKKILEANSSDYDFKIDSFEEGYLSVDVRKNAKLFFGMQVVDINNKKVGLFFVDGEENYITNPKEIVDYI